MEIWKFRPSIMISIFINFEYFEKVHIKISLGLELHIEKAAIFLRLFYFRFHR